LITHTSNGDRLREYLTDLLRMNHSMVKPFPEFVELCLFWSE
jgi:hypothetical protein